MRTSLDLETMPDTSNELLTRGTRDSLPDGAEHSGGILVVDKPEGVSSAAVAARVKKLLGVRKIGHAGTLDPFATGVLLLCLEEGTRAADQFVNLCKDYVATLRFGMETDTLDKTGKPVRVSDVRFSEKELLEAADSFRGGYVQKVPRFSAVKVGGKRLYELSRKGIEVDRPEREIRIHSIAVRSFEWPEAVLEVSCSKGTYIRQLASDMGEKLGSGAHLAALRRTSIGAFHVERALRADQFRAELSEKERIRRCVIPLNEALSHLPCAFAREERVLARLRNGQLDPEWERKQMESFFAYAGAVRIVAGSNRLAALWWPNPEPGSRRLRVFPF